MIRAGSPKDVWLDANIVLRLLTGQPKGQAQAAAALMARVDAGELRRMALAALVACASSLIVGREARRAQIPSAALFS